MDSPKLYDVVPAEGPMQQRIMNSFQDRQRLWMVDSPQKAPIAPRDWQICAATEFLNRRDVIVITATGSGKSLSYLLTPIANSGKVLLAIFPLLSLMTDQVSFTMRPRIHPES